MIRNRLIKRTSQFMRLLGFDPKMFVLFFAGLPFYIRDYIKLTRQLKKNQDFRIQTFFPVLHERFLESGTIDLIYFHQDLFLARRVLENNPLRHIDIGSRIDGFVAHVAVFREIEVYDIRVQTIVAKNIVFKQADLMNLPEGLIGTLESVSSLHTIEHFGLGRYSDEIDVNGHLKGIDNIHKMLRPGGRFYFSVPIGPQRIEFNAHRVFSVSYLLKVFVDRFKVDRFNYINDEGIIFEDIELEADSVNGNYNCHYGCGIFELVKL